jgi:hypothetical protein
MPEDPQVDILQKYPQDFLDNLNSQATEFKKAGATDDQISVFFTDAFTAYNTAKAPSDESFESKPDWFRESQVDLKNETAKRGIIRQTGWSIKNLIPVKTPGVGIGVSFINPFRGQREEKDVISRDMVMDADAFRDVNVDMEVHMKTARDEMRAKYNKTGERTMNNNIDILLEESYSEMVEQEVSSAISSLAKEKGLHKRDILLGDPEDVNKFKEQFRELGFSGRTVERGFEKALNEKSRKIYAAHHENDIANSMGEAEYEANKDALRKYYTDESINLAVELFDADEYGRLQDNMRLQGLIEQERSLQKSGKDPEQLKKLQLEIKELDAKIGEDYAKKDQEPPKKYKNKFLAGFGMFAGAPVKQKGRQWNNEVYYRMYNTDGSKVMRGDEPEDQVIHQQQVTAAIKTIPKEVLDTPEALRKEMLNSRKILFDIESAQDWVKESKINNKEWSSTATDGERESVIRTMKNIRTQKQQELIYFEAVSRMYLLNQNVALEDKNARNYLLDAANVFRDINAAPFINNPNPSTEDVRHVVRQVAQDAGIPLDSKDWEMTEEDLTRDVLRSTAGVSDVAIKMALMNKGGFNVVNSFFEGMATAGKVGKAASHLFRAMVEEKKFKMIGGEDGTGAAFYVADKGFPAIKTGNKGLDIVWNGFLKGTAGMTIAMEGSHHIVQGYDALANDKDFMRTIKETWGTRDERQRRMLVELMSASPFGIKGMAERGAFYRAKSKPVYEMAEELIKEGDHVGGEQLKYRCATTCLRLIGLRSMESMTPR